MTEKRLYNIINKVIEKCTNGDKPVPKDTVINEISAVVRGLYKTENFLHSYTVDLKKRVIICREPEKEFSFISFLPYIVPELQRKKADEEVFLLYLQPTKETACLMGTISFIDLRLTSYDEVGFDLKTHDARTLGHYVPSTNEFYKWN